MTDLELLDCVLAQHPIVTHRIFLHITKDLKAAAFFGQLYYWSKNMKHDWFYKTIDSWGEELFLTAFEQRGIRKKLKEMGLLEEKRKGSPAKLYFKLNFQRLIELAKQYYSQTERNLTSRSEESGYLDVKKLNNKMLRNFTSLYTENTTEITTENTNTLADKVSAPVVVEIFHQELPSLPKVKVLTEERVKQVKQTVKKYPKAEDVEWWRKYFQRVGEIGWMHNAEGKWKANFDFLTRYSTVIKIIEGIY